MENYNIIIMLSARAENVFKALTSEIPFWWTEMFEGVSNLQNDSFIVRFGDSIYKKIKVKELIHNLQVVWYIEDSLIDIPGLENQKEWISTTIIWEIIEKGNTTELHLTHIGLCPDIECYKLCTDGGKQFTTSLKLYLETDKGAPFLNQH